MAEPTETIRVKIKLRTGGGLDGLVVDQSDHGIVVVHDHTPYVFSWREMDPSNAYEVKRALIHFLRGNHKYDAADFFELGRFALHVNRADLAAQNFHYTQALDPAYKVKIRKAFEAFQVRRQERKKARRDLLQPVSRDRSPTPADGPKRQQDDTGTPAGSTRPRKGAARLDPVARGPLRDHEKDVLTAYQTFNRKVSEVLDHQIEFFESEHFLIGTDWEKRYRDQLAHWCESMYAALSARFGIAASEPVFLAKCPVYGFRSQKRFRKFAEYFDGFFARDSIGYTRSIEADGHVHVVLLRKGRSMADFDRFACTLVHEGTHAFLHRLYSTRLIPHWVNEGIAELTAEHVLGDRCPAGENADLLGLQFARFDWSINDLLHSTRPIEVYEYPLACSVITYLESLDPKRLTGFIADLKDGRSVEEAMAHRFDGMTTDQLEARWKKWILTRNAAQPAAPAEEAHQGNPWHLLEPPEIIPGK